MLDSRLFIQQVSTLCLLYTRSYGSAMEIEFKVNSGNIKPLQWILLFLFFNSQDMGNVFKQTENNAYLMNSKPPWWNAQIYDTENKYKRKVDIL